MKKPQLSVKLLLTCALALAMTMPATFFVSSMPGGNPAPITAFPGTEAEYQAIVEAGGTVYGAWIEGEVHDTVILFSSSKDGGATWKTPVAITDTDHVPLNVEMAAGTRSLHLVWMDAASRLLRTCYVSYDMAEGGWTDPLVFDGENPDLAVEDHTVVIGTNTGSSFSIYLSRDNGHNFEILKPMPDVECQYPAVGIQDGKVHAASIGRSTLGAVRGIYHSSSNTGSGWSVPILAVKAVDWMKDVDIESDNGGLSLIWREVSTDSIDYFSSEMTSSGFGPRILVSSDPVIREEAETAESYGRLPPKKWTYLCYLDADNNLDSAGYADMDEMETVGTNADLNIVVLFDGDTFSGPDTHAYLINPGSRTEIPLTEINPTWTSGELNMGDPQTAIDFVEYVFAEYPADRYMWDMWNHGGSWNWAMCSDDTSGDHLTSLEVRTIYETVRADTGKIKLFDVAGYDECLMADCSVYYDMMPYIDYMCNSEDSIGFDGWEYDLMLDYLNADLDMRGEEAAFYVFQAYVDAWGTSGSVTTMSVINATMLASTLAPALNNLAQKAIHEISTHRSDLQSAANAARSWQGYTHQKDLYDFVDLAIASIPVGPVNVALQQVRDAATANPVGTTYGHPAWQHDRTILIHNQNTDEHGMKIYIADPPYDTEFDTMTLSETNWDEFYQVLWGSDASQPNIEPIVTIINPPDGGYVAMDAINTVTGTATDPDGTVSRVDVTVDTEHWSPASGTTSWSFDWDTTGWGPGWHTIMARAFDGQDFSTIAKHEVYLLNNQPPTVTLLDNNGQAEDGTWAGTEQVTWLATDPNEDDALLDIMVEYSPDAGGSWFTIEDDVDNNDGSCAWDTTVAPDGPNNMLRVTVTDNQGNTSTDESDAVFTLDNEPTVTVITPNGGESFLGGGANIISWDMGDWKDPIGDLTVNIYYSTDSGASYPNTVTTGLTGFTMNPCEYIWDPTPVLDVSTVRIRVEVIDADGADGVDDSDADFDIDSTAPLPAADTDAELVGLNVEISWSPSPSIDIDHYDVYYKTNGWDPNGNGYVYLGTSTGTSLQHVNGGINNPSSFFYQVRAVDAAGNVARTQFQAGKLGTTQSTFSNPSGWFMLGSFLEQSDNSLAHILQGQGIPAYWDQIQRYDAFDPVDHWKSCIVGRPSNLNDLSEIGNTEGFWLHLTGNSRWTTAGKVLNLSMSLKAGWNLVPYPFVQRTMSTSAIESILIANCPNFDRWEIADYTAGYLLKTPNGTENLLHGSAFWVYVTADGTWQINYY